METTSLIKKYQDWFRSVVVVLGGYQLIRQQVGSSGMLLSLACLRGLALLEDPHEEVGRVPHGAPCHFEASPIISFSVLPGQSNTEIAS